MTLEDIKNKRILIELSTDYRLENLLDKDDLEVIVESLEDYHDKKLSEIDNTEVMEAIYDYLYDNYYDNIINKLLDNSSVEISFY